MKYLIYIVGFIMVQYANAQTVESKDKTGNLVNPYLEEPLTSNHFLYFDSEIIKMDFKEFTPHFNKNNIELLEKSKMLWGVEYGIQYKKLFFGGNINFGSQKGTVNDTIDAKINHTRTGFSVGYYLLNTKHLQLVPRMSFYLSSTSLKNFNAKDKIPLDDYTNNPDFKLTFQTISTQIGLDFNYKIPSITTKPGQPFLIGFKTAYNFDLGNTWVKSDENTLSTNSKIKLDHITFGFHFTILI